MAQKLMKRCSASLAVWNMQIQTTVRGRFTPTRLADFWSLGSLPLRALGCKAESVVLQEGGPNAPTNKEAHFWTSAVLQDLAEACAHWGGLGLEVGLSRCKLLYIG